MNDEGIAWGGGYRRICCSEVGSSEYMYAPIRQPSCRVDSFTIFRYPTTYYTETEATSSHFILFRVRVRKNHLSKSGHLILTNAGSG